MAFKKGLLRSMGLASLLATSFVATIAPQAPATAANPPPVAPVKRAPASVAQQAAPVGDGSGPADGASASQPPSWSVGCAATERSAALNCAVEQRVFVANSGQLVGSVSVRLPGDAGGPIMTITTPLGLFVPAGVSIAIDEDAAQTLEVQTCDAHGCYAESPVSDNLLSRMLKGKKLNVGFQDLSKQPINLALSLIGFSDAFAKIK
jgi:invasion protein IalB